MTTPDTAPESPPAEPVHMVLPGPIVTLTGGFIYDRHMVEALRRRGRLGALICLDGSFPAPGAQDLRVAARRLDDLPRTGPVVVDGLALTALMSMGPSPLTARAVIALIHHPLCDETGLTASQSRALHEAEQRALVRVRGTIVTSPATRRRLADFGLGEDRTRVVIPGIDRPATRIERPIGKPDGCRILCVATLCPRKGQDVLVEALAGLRDLSWRLDLVGGTRDPVFARTLRAVVADHELSHRVHFRGEIAGAALKHHYAEADVFALASHHEGYGIALAEAMAHGLPIISCRAGAIPDTVPEAAGALVPPGDVPALRDALRRFLGDREARRRAGAAARLAAERLPGWPQAGETFITAVDDLMAVR